MIGNFRQTYKLIRAEKSGLKTFLSFVFVPLIVSALPLVFPLVSLSDIGSNFLAGLSLFVGILFSLIITISDKVKTKKEELGNSADASHLARLSAYIKFGQDTVTVIISVVYLSIITIVTILISQLCLDMPNAQIANLIWTKVITAIQLYLGCVLLYLTYYIITAMYEFFFGDMTA